MNVSETREGSIVEVFVKPKSEEFKVKAEGDEVIVFCTEEPVKGRVNKELIKEFSKLFHKKVEIVSGFTSKQKRLLIMGADRKEVERVLLSR